MYTPDPNNPYAEKMAEQEKLYGLPTGILQAVAKRESGYDPNADSGAAHGLMQFTPSTWASVSKDLGLTDSSDPEQSIEAAAYYLDQINKGLPADKQNDPGWMAAAYNDGPAAVAKMTSLEDIRNLPYADKEARYAYATGIQSEVGGNPGVQAAGAGALAGVAPTGGGSQSNPNWGKTEGPYTVVGTPITDSGINWVSPVPEGTPVYQYYGDTSVDNLGPYYARVNKGFGHEGIDWMLPEGTHIGAVADGKVVWASDGTKAGRPAYGNLIIVDNGNGYRSLYGHLSGFNVKVGDTVTAGQYIGDVGHTPDSANIGNHLHLAIEKAGDNTGPWNTIDPFRLIGGGQQPTQMAQQAGPPVIGQQAQRPGQLPATATTLQDATATQPSQPVIAEGPPASGQPATSQTYDPNNPGANVSLPPVAQVAGTQPGANDLQTYRDSVANSYRSPIQQAQEAKFGQQDQAALDYVNKLYPQYAHEYQEYDAIMLDKDRQAYAAAHPEVRAVNLAYHNPAESQQVESIFGAGALLRYARIPASEAAGGQPGATSAYYHQDPGSFLVKAYIDGRPQIHDQSDNTITPRNWGADYAEAKQKFGPDIWSVVQDYYRLPGGDDLASRTARAKWYQANPVYGAWNDWWYANLPDNQAASAGYGRSFQTYHRSGGGDFFSPSNQTSSLEMIRSNAVQLARARRSGVDGGSWRKWLNMGKQ